MKSSGQQDPLNPNQPDSSGNGQPPATTQAAQQIVWLVLLAAVGMYAVVGTVVKPNTVAASVPPESLSVMSMAFCALAIVQTGIAMLAPRILTKMPPVSLYIVRWAIAESIAIFGLILRFMGASNTWFYGFIIWSAMLLITLRPNQDERR